MIIVSRIRGSICLVPQVVVFVVWCWCSLRVLVFELLVVVAPNVEWAVGVRDLTARAQDAGGCDVCLSVGRKL